MSKASGVLEVSEVTTLVAHLESLRKKIDSLYLPKPVTFMACEKCGGGHMVNDCSIVGVADGPK